MSSPTLSVIPTSKIAIGDDNPRGAIDTSSESFAELCVSIRARGILQPILVAPANGDGKHKLIAGHRRHAAALDVKLAEMPAMVMDLEGAELLAALTENIQREDLDPVAEAQAIKKLQEDHGFTQLKAADALGKSERWVRDRLLLLGLPEKAQEAFNSGALPLESLREVRKIAEQAPRAAEMLAEAVTDVPEIRQAIGAGEVAEALDRALEEADGMAGADEKAPAGCMVSIGYGTIDVRELGFHGISNHDLARLKDKTARADALAKEVDQFVGPQGYLSSGDIDRDAAKAFGCLLEVDGREYITDAAWLADQFGKSLDEKIKKLEKMPKKGDAPAKPGASDDGDPAAAEEAAKAERKRQREQEQAEREAARAANLELGQRAEKAFREPDLTVEEARMLVLLAIGADVEAVAGRGLIYCHHDYQDETHLKNGGVKVAYRSGKSAGADLLNALEKGKTPEAVLAMGVRLILLAVFADEKAVTNSNRTRWQPRGTYGGGRLSALALKIAKKRGVLPDSLRKEMEERERERAEEAKIEVESNEGMALELAGKSRAKHGAGAVEIRQKIFKCSFSCTYLSVAELDELLSDLSERKFLKGYDGDGVATYTITAAGKKRLEKLKAAEKERQAS
jgi:ParB family chromosome partitioning protein